MAGIARMGGKNQRVRITAAEYAETYDVSLDTAYTQLKSAVENIFERYLQFQVWEGKKKVLSVSAGLAVIGILIKKVLFNSASQVRFFLPVRANGTIHEISVKTGGCPTLPAFLAVT